MITNEMRTYKNLVKYKIDGFDILFNNGDIEKIENDMISHLYIEKDFDNLYFPLINISVLMGDKLYDRINQEIETVQFRLKIIKNIYDKDNKFLKYELYCNQLFRSFMEKKNVIKDNQQVEDKEKTENTSETARGNMRNFYLFTDDIVNCKKMMNMSIESADLTDLVLYLLGECGVKKLLMSKLDNRDRVDGMVIPNGNIIDTLKYLENQKGFYNKGALLFFDVDCAYLIDRNAKCTSWRPNEVKVTHIHVSNQKNGDSELNGQFVSKDRKINHVFTNTNRIDMMNSNVINDQLKGNELVIINGKSNNVKNVSSDSTQVGKPNKRMLISKNDNMFTVSALQNSLHENECMCDIALLGIDIDIFTPNKEIILTYEDPKLNAKYKGNYRIVKLISTFKKDGEELIGEVQISLKKQ